MFLYIYCIAEYFVVSKAGGAICWCQTPPHNIILYYIILYYIILYYIMLRTL